MTEQLDNIDKNDKFISLILVYMLKDKSYLLRFDFNPRDISKGIFISNATKNSKWTYSSNLLKKTLNYIPYSEKIPDTC